MSCGNDLMSGIISASVMASCLRAAMVDRLDSFRRTTILTPITGLITVLAFSAFSSSIELW